MVYDIVVLSGAKACRITRSCLIGHHRAGLTRDAHIHPTILGYVATEASPASSTGSPTSVLASNAASEAAACYSARSACSSHRTLDSATSLASTATTAATTMCLGPSSFFKKTKKQKTKKSYYAVHVLNLVLFGRSVLCARKRLI